MILKYGVWKNGQLVGKTGSKEPIMIEKDSPEAKVSVLFEFLYMLKVVLMTSQQLATLPAPSVPLVPEMDSKPRVHPDEQTPRYIDSDISLDSEDSDDSKDLPPPYKV